MNLDILKKEWNEADFSGAGRERTTEEILTSENKSYYIELKMTSKYQIFFIPALIILFLLFDINEPDILPRLLWAVGFLAIYLPVQILKYRSVKRIDFSRYSLKDVVVSLKNLRKILNIEIIVYSLAVISGIIWALFHFFIGKWNSSEQQFQVDFALFIFGAIVIIALTTILSIFVFGFDIKRIGKILNNIGSID